MSGFIRFDRHGKQEHGILAGSGTLLAVDDVRAIVTAEHVAAISRGHVRSGLVSNVRPDGRLHRFGRSRIHSAIVKASNDEHGPDVAALVLTPAMAAGIGARSSFYDFPSRKCGCSSIRLPLSVVGRFVGIHRRILDHPSRRSWVRDGQVFYILMRGRVIGLESECGDFDYLRFEVAYNKGYEGPQSFTGVSGGGLWHVFPRVDGESVEIGEALFSGVAFKQTSSAAVEQ